MVAGKMSSLNAKVAIVAGSTNGIGEATVRLLSENGAKLIINSVKSVEKGQQLASELPGSIYLQGDIAIEADSKKIIDKTIEHFGRLDILVAGQYANYFFRESDALALTYAFYLIRLIHQKNDAAALNQLIEKVLNTNSRVLYHLIRLGAFNPASLII